MLNLLSNFKMYVNLNGKKTSKQALNRVKFCREFLSDGIIYSSKIRKNTEYNFKKLYMPGQKIKIRDEIIFRRNKSQFTKNLHRIKENWTWTLSERFSSSPHKKPQINWCLVKEREYTKQFERRSKKRTSSSRKMTKQYTEHFLDASKGVSSSV